MKKYFVAFFFGLAGWDVPMVYHSYLNYQYEMMVLWIFCLLTAVYAGFWWMSKP